jgi:hypothetical protein
MQNDDVNKFDNGNDNGDLRTSLVRWLFGQEANTILLFLILGSIAWFAKYCVDTAVPAHLRMIQTGYERVASQHAAEVRDLRESFERTAERQERLMREIVAGGG